MWSMLFWAKFKESKLACFAVNNEQYMPLGYKNCTLVFSEKQGTIKDTTAILERYNCYSAMALSNGKIMFSLWSKVELRKCK